MSSFSRGFRCLEFTESSPFPYLLQIFMKFKLFFVLSLIALLFVAPIPKANASVQNDAAGKAVDALLQQSTQSEWSLMALAAAGKINTLDVDVVKETLQDFDTSSATDVEKTIMAVVAAGKNPRTYFSKGDIVDEFLKTFFDGAQLGDTKQLNDDAWGVIALAASGVSATDATMQKLVQHIRGAQHTDGGWGATTDTTQTADVDNTAAAVMALRVAGVVSSDAALRAAIAFLHTEQNSDGGFRGYGDTTSNTDSTTWTFVALNALSENMDNWKPNGKTPADFIVSMQNADGTFLWKSDSTTKANTSFAVVALLGKTFPVATLATTSPFVTFRIEGKDKTICSGSVYAQNVMDVIANAASQCGFTYTLHDSNSYLYAISDDAASGMTGWLYFVNWKSGTTAAADAQLQNGDEVLWYYGDYNWLPLRLTLSATTLQNNKTTKALVESFDGATWRSESSATITTDTLTFVTIVDGTVTLASLPAGITNAVAEKTGFVRSNTVEINVGKSSSAIDLRAVIDIPDRTPQSEPEIAFTVTSGPIDFGTLQPGVASTAHDVIIENTGQLSIAVAAEVSGDKLFVEHLLLNAFGWSSYGISLEKTSGQVADVALAVPSDYTQEGSVTGQLIFWAQAE